jgi:hypothetical protein
LANITDYITTKGVLAYNIHYVNQLYKSMGYSDRAVDKWTHTQHVVVPARKNHEGGVPRNAVYTPREFRSIFDEITSPEF